MTGIIDGIWDKFIMLRDSFNMVELEEFSRELGHSVDNMLTLLDELHKNRFILYTVTPGRNIIKITLEKGENFG